MAQLGARHPAPALPFAQRKILLGTLEAVVGISGVAKAGQGTVAVLSDRRREENVVSQIRRIVIGPVTGAPRLQIPRFVPGWRFAFVALGGRWWAWRLASVAPANLPRGG